MTSRHHWLTTADGVLEGMVSFHRLEEEMGLSSWGIAGESETTTWEVMFVLVRADDDVNILRYWIYDMDQRESGSTRE